MYKGSPYYVETQLGKLQLTKGAYLTLKKRKSSTLRTLEKTKIILKECPKPTVKRKLRNRCRQYFHRQQMVIFDSLGDQHERFKNKMLGSFPTIQMTYDNDAQSEWPQIEGCVNNLSLSLSLAVFDQSFKQD